MSCFSRALNCVTCCFLKIISSLIICAMSSSLPPKYIHCFLYFHWLVCTGKSTFEGYSASDYVKPKCLAQFLGGITDFLIDRPKSNFFETS